jgi:hypothetical protein
MNWDTTKRQNLCIIGIEEVQTKDKDNIFNKIIAENVLNLKKERVTQIQEVFKATRNKTKKKRTSPMNIIVKTLNIQNKERVL